MSKMGWQTLVTLAGTMALVSLLVKGGITSAAPQAYGSSGYTLANKFTLGGPGGWDYLEVDPATHRVFISRGTHVMVVDPAAGKVVGDIPNTQGVHGIALAPEFNHGFTSNGMSATATMFDMTTLQTLGEPKTDKGPDAIIYDPGSKRVFTMNGAASSATAIDAKTGEVAGTVALGGRPEFAAADGKGHVFANLEDKSALVEIDSKALTLMNTWPFTFQTAYSPLWKLENVCVLRTVLLTASIMEMVWARAVVFQSNKYSVILCAFPSVKFKLMVKLPAA